MTALPVVQDQSPASGLVSQIERIACNPDADISKLEKLWEMQEKALDRQALQAYNASMSAMQSKMPVISKNGEIKVNNVVRSKYARFEDIVKAIRPLLDEHGFSISFKTEFSNGIIVIHGSVSHTGGHCEKTSMSLPHDNSGSKNSVQAIGSSVQYGKRYVLCMLLNIATSGEDDDGTSAAGDEFMKVCFERDKLLKLSNSIRENFNTVQCIKDGIRENDLSTVAEAWRELSDDDKHALWVAPTKGGIFTTEERKIMKEGLPKQ